MVRQDAKVDRDAYVAGRDLYFGAAIDHKNGELVCYDRHRPVFIQYLNPEILAAYGKPIRPDGTQLGLAEALHATRTALLATDAYLVFPASYLFEATQLSVILSSAHQLTDCGLISYCSPVSDLSMYGEQKLAEYRGDTRNPYTRPKRTGMGRDLVWRPRQHLGTADDIKREWMVALNAGGQLEKLAKRIRERWPVSTGDMEARLGEVPELLAGRAFITRFVSQTIPVALKQPELRQLDLLLSRAYLKSYLNDTGSLLVTDFPFGSLSCGLVPHEDRLEGRLVSAFTIDLALKWLGIYEYVHNRATWLDLIKLRSTAEFGFVLQHSQDVRARHVLRRAIIRCHRKGDLDEAATSLASTLATIRAVAIRLDGIEA